MAPTAILVGSVISAAGSISAGQAQKRAAQQNARSALGQAKEEARKSRRGTDALKGRQRALFANSGTTMEGSPVRVVEDTAKEAETEVKHIMQGGEARARAFRQSGQAAAQAGFFGAGSTLLSGVGKALVVKEQ